MTTTQHARAWLQSLWSQVCRPWDAMWDEQWRRVCVIQDCDTPWFRRWSMAVYPLRHEDDCPVTDYCIQGGFDARDEYRRVFRLSRLFRGPCRWVKSLIPLKAGGLGR